MSLELSQYIKDNYRKFLDYAKFHADKNNLSGMGEELLQFVLEIVFADIDRPKVEKLLNTRYGNYNELHTYILGMIKINAFSPRSDFRRKILNRLPIDHKVNFRRLDIECSDYSDYDYASDVLTKFERIRIELDKADIPDLAKDIFRWKFICGNQISEWPGMEPKSKLYKMYNVAVAAIKEKVNRQKAEINLF